MNPDRFRNSPPYGDSQQFRRGFTLLELLMVIVIIGILTALITVASMSVIGSSREAATKATLSKINTMLKQRMAALETQLDNDFTRGVYRTDPDLPSVNSLTEPIKKVFYRKKLFRKYFPQTWEEVRSANILPTSELQTVASAPGVEADSESAEVLFAVLTKTSITGQGEIGQDAFLTSEVGDRDGDGRKELIDAWGNPLRFYRWPCRLIKPTAVAPAYAQPLNNTSPNPEIAAAENAAARTQIPSLTKNTADPTLNTDPDNPMNFDLPNLILYQNAPPGYLDQYHIPLTFHTPLVVSAGVDGLFGLESPIDSTNSDHRQALPDYQTAINASASTSDIEREKGELYDNLTNLNGLAGGSQ